MIERKLKGMTPASPGWVVIAVFCWDPEDNEEGLRPEIERHALVGWGHYRLTSGDDAADHVVPMIFDDDFMEAMPATNDDHLDPRRFIAVVNERDSRDPEKLREWRERADSIERDWIERLNRT